MKRITPFILSIATLFTACINSGNKASVNDLQLISGISNHKLILDGTEGSTTSFTFKANHDWQIIDYKGFDCYPSSGPKTQGNETITVVATALQSNNSTDTIRLSDLNFKMLSTRFVGISAYQLPQICLKSGSKVTINAIEGSVATAKIVSKAEYIELTTSGDITATLGASNNRNERTITITATGSNNTTEERILGSVGFVVDGVAQKGKIEVRQLPAIVFDRTLVLLPGEENRSNMFEVKSDFDLDFDYTSDLFTVSKTGKNTFEVTSNTRNDSNKTLSLGEIEVSLKDTPSCCATIKVAQRKAIASQTIIIHFVGTALREPYFTSNLQKMLEALSHNIQGDARVMAITTESTTDGILYELRYDENLGKAVKEKVKDLDLKTPYNANLLKFNLQKALEFAPADKYALVIGSHGLGWVPKVSSAATSRALMRMGISPASLWERNKGAEMTRHIGDKGEIVQYDVHEIASAIESNNIKLEYILFDACFMGNVESAYDLRNATKYIIGSPCEVMGYGFPYINIMQHMLTEGGKSYNLDKICSEYVNYYRTGAATPSACVALTHTSELEALATAMKAVNNAGIKEDFALNQVQYYEGQGQHSFYDLGDMVEQSCADSTVASAFKTQLDKTVTSRYHTDQFYSAYGSSNKYYHDIKYYSGITTSANVEHYAADWQQTAWYKATH